MYNKVLIAYDGSHGARIALDQAARLAVKLSASLTAVWVRESLPHYPETVDEIEQEETSADRFAERLAAEVAQVAAATGVDIFFEVVAGHPAKEILKTAERERVDLVVVGSGGHSAWGRLLGHTADRIGEHAHCSVLIAR